METWKLIVGALAIASLCMVIYFIHAHCEKHFQYTFLSKQTLSRIIVSIIFIVSGQFLQKYPIFGGRWEVVTYWILITLGVIIGIYLIFENCEATTWKIGLGISIIQLPILYACALVVVAMWTTMLFLKILGGIVSMAANGQDSDTDPRDESAWLDKKNCAGPNYQPPSKYS